MSDELQKAEEYVRKCAREQGVSRAVAVMHMQNWHPDLFEAFMSKHHAEPPENW